MKRIITNVVLIAGLAFGALAQSVTAPVDGGYYRIRHASGNYLTSEGFSTKINAKVEDNSQIFQFIVVDKDNSVYNIKRANSGMFVGTDNKWTCCPVSRNVPQTQYVVAPSTVDDNYVTLSVLSMSEGKRSLGTDDTTAGSSVYTDKAGTDKDKHLWVIEEADIYPVAPGEEPVDHYADYQLPEGDPRATAYPGYKLVFAEEFSGSGTPDHEVWNFEEGFKRNSENQYYNGDKNCFIQDGVLAIEGRYVLDEQIKNPKYDKYNTGWPSSLGKYIEWTSGSMQSQSVWNGGYSWIYGIYEIRAKVPQYTGCWPAIWSTGKSHEWPYGGEIDIMEYYGGGIHANVCWGDGRRWAGSWNSAFVRDADLGQNWGDDFHIWRMVWDYDHMELWFDDLLVNNINLDTTQNKECTTEGVDDGDGNNPFRDVRQMLWLNLALGGINGGSLSKTPRSSYFFVDYARVYQKIGDDGAAKYHVDEEISEPNLTLQDGVPSGVSDVVVDLNEEVLGVYNLQGIRVGSTEEEAAQCGRGVYIVVRKSGSTKVVL